MKKRVLVYTISIIFALLIGFLSNLIAGGADSVRLYYSSLVLPPFAPKPMIFGIVWSILYVLMGISAARVYLKDDTPAKPAQAIGLIVYFLQLVVNFLWTIVFFKFESIFGALIVLCVLIFLEILLICLFYKVDKLSAYLLIPYLLWSIFALILNLSIYFLNA